MFGKRSSWTWIGAFALLVGVLACTWGAKREGAQYWWEERGPVVPHDSFPADCTLCHQGETWRDIRADFVFDHEKETGHRLEGAHAAAECLRCHNDRGPVQVFASRGCAGCHEDVHQTKLGRDCTSCHDQNTFRPTEQIAMHSRTRFPLVGAHAATECFRCHSGAEVGRFQPVDTECLACHTADLARATNPDHAANGWTNDCDRCHIPTAWSGQAFNHSWWPLTGAHATANCTQCHAGGMFVGTPNQCVDCHLAEYNGATSPNHVALGISTDCADCHGTSTWLGAHFNHTGIVDGCVNCHLTDFQGTTSPDHEALGISTSCEQCHGTNTWFGAQFDHTGIVNGCVACHQTDYDNTTSPDHAVMGIGTNCEQCHDTLDWNNAQFDHTGITNGCVACHLPDYNGTTNPKHSTAGFGTDCETCHDTLDWNNGQFSHPQFPITTGKHKNFDCIDCHLAPPNYVQFSCTHCHEHSKSKMDGEHDDVNNYVWNSNNCYACHPDGKE